MLLSQRALAYLRPTASKPQDPHQKRVSIAPTHTADRILYGMLYVDTVLYGIVHVRNAEWGLASDKEEEKGGGFLRKPWP